LIVACGPSAANERLEVAKDRVRCIAIKSSWRLCPWADVLYGTDRGWWLANRGATEFGGLRLTASPSIATLFPGVQRIRLKPHKRLAIGRISGEHSGEIAISLAVNFGARRILLVGFDMALDYRRSEAGVAKHDNGRVERWRRAMDEQAAHYRALGLEVVNCSESSRLAAFPKMSLAEALDAGRHQGAAA
jgi:hypothetical protein